MNKINIAIIILLATLTCAFAQSPAPIRPPATPLITHDPYFSIWATGDLLTDQPTKHWTGSNQPVTGLVRIDSKVYRFLGSSPAMADPSIEALKQISLRITPTRTIAAFEGAGIHLDLTFLTPALPDDLDVLSRPVTYVIWDARSIDGGRHKLSVYLDATASLTVNRTNEQRTAWSRTEAGRMRIAKLGAVDQRVLARSGDDLRIEWGYLFLAAAGNGVNTIGTTLEERASYLSSLSLPESKDLDSPSSTVGRLTPLIGLSIDLGEVGAASVSRHALIAYDDEFSIEYFNRRLRPYWRRDNRTGAQALLTQAEKEFETLKVRCERFDEELTKDLVTAGGAKYAALATVAYRQTLAAHKLVADFDGTPLLFSKENFSNGCIATVDVTYPSSPFFLLFNTNLMKAMLRPVMDYAKSPRWRFPYAPHDLGTYPLANGQVYGGGEDNDRNQMPVEESGNMLIMLAALADAEGNAEFSKAYWPVITRWADYLRDKGLDPENQLCTDDFAGHLAHNSNLSIKAIVALAAYGHLADMLGDRAHADSYRQVSASMAKQWETMANDGDHYRLTFDKPGTWSQKYNLVWDKLLGLKLFPSAVAAREIAYYKTKQNEFGLPLDNRSTYTKLDWIIWTATLASNSSDFKALVDPAYKFANETPTRVPLSDWYWTQDGKQRGFQARSVVGGIFIKLLEDKAMWKKWSSRTGAK